jgi:hypothetical protein
MDDGTLDDSRQRGRGPGGPLAMHSYLFVALEGDRPLAGGARYALSGIDEVVIGRGPERTTVRTSVHGVRRLELRLPGRSLSTVHARIVRTPQGWALQDAGSTNGSFVNGERVERAELGPSDVIEVGHSLLVVRVFPVCVDEPPADVDGRELAGPVGFATLVPPLVPRLADLRRIAAADISVVLCGETGTGKEMLARGVHALSGRSGPFVAVNCGALTESLAESQLFGHVRGAFSGAVAETTGFVRAAHGGTLLLDEVNDLSAAAQSALLRVLQEREVIPVGSARPHAIDVRFIATSPRPLHEDVQARGFRRDLLARLSGYTHHATPLRQRREDLGLLVAALLEKMGVSAGDQPTVAPDLGLALLRHEWPLNVRELEQALRRGWALSRGGRLEDVQLTPEPLPADTPPHSVLSAQEQELRERVVGALTASRGNVAQVARTLGTARMQVHRWMKRLGIEAAAFRNN